MPMFPEEFRWSRPFSLFWSFLSAKGGRCTALVLFLAMGALSLLVAPQLSAQTVMQNPDFQWVVDIPVGWEILDAQRTDFISFSDPDRVAVLQIISFPGDRFVTVEELDEFIRTRFSASGEAVPFRYHGDFAIFADYRFTAGSSGGGGIPVRGYMTFINGEEFDHAVMTFVVEEFWEEKHETILSALDSFSKDLESRLLPGPVSAFYTADVHEAMRADTTDARERTVILPSGESFSLPAAVAREELIEGAQVLVEREARVLQPWAPADGVPRRFTEEPAPFWAQAWRRYFRMLYRDSYDRLAPVAEALFHDLAGAGYPREEMPAQILVWLQGAEYRRTGSLSDLMNPAWCLVDFAGDCDSLGLTYAILLHHLGFDAILMVSLEYAHAMVGVDLPGSGARFPFEGRQWLVAELTAPVALGQIEETMADIGGWVGIKLDPTGW